MGASQWLCVATLVVVFRVFHLHTFTRSHFIVFSPSFNSWPAGPELALFREIARHALPCRLERILYSPQPAMERCDDFYVFACVPACAVIGGKWCVHFELAVWCTVCSLRRRRPSPYLALNQPSAHPTRALSIATMRAEVLGYTREELSAVPYASFIHPDDLESTFAIAKGLFSGEDIVQFQNRCVAVGGRCCVPCVVLLQLSARRNIEFPLTPCSPRTRPMLA